MDHVAIMKKSWGFTDKIYAGHKTIESRWYMTKRAPWGSISSGDTIYFKNSGEPITLKAKVKKVLTFSEITPVKVQELLQKYGTAIGIDPKDTVTFYTLLKDKKYCLLIFLSVVKKVVSFEVEKRGFGAMAAWLTVPAIRSIRR